ncbi:MAG: hypothetical protein FJW90_00815 [Actinobacteria bacterium]|nr:hypothetical protein [Actinomycetota bacterium]
MRSARLAVVALAVAVSVTAGAASGCSETDDLSDRLTKAQYVLEMKALVARVQRESRLAAELLSVDSLAEAAPVIGEVVEQFDEIVARLEEIEPPEEVATVHNALASAMSSASDLLTDAKGAVESDDIASLLLLLAPQLADFREQFRGIVSGYEAQGYELGAEPQAP